MCPYIAYDYVTCVSMCIHVDLQTVKRQMAANTQFGAL